MPLIPRDYFGRHSSIDELLTSLYLENLHYRRQLSAVTSPMEVLPPAPHEVKDRDRYAAVREYTEIEWRRRGTDRHLLIANDYPDYGKEYGNGFVHRRVKAYQESGLSVDVVLFHRAARRRVYEYDGVRVLSGGIDELNGLLTMQDYRSISVHFLNREMWSTLFHHRRVQSTPLHVYVHGFEARHWWKRRHDLHTARDLRRAIERSIELREFWAEVTSSAYSPDTFIFVSRFWSEVMQEDMDVVVPPDKLRVIHNFIDTDLFRFQPKADDQRFRILWARSAAASHYGADIAVEFLRRMLQSRHSSQLAVTIVGDGSQFSLFENAFEDDSRVSLTRGFVSQEKVAELHRSHGLFLVPTRLDTQGVSRDEAMSSGLVPITNAVAAVPEFADSSCAVLAPPEDVDAMVKGALELIDNPDIFQAKSSEASLRARRQCGWSFTVEQEIAMMTGGGDR